MNEVFSPIDNEAPLRLWRRLHLIPPHSLGTGRRAIFLALLAWLPIMLWTAIEGRILGTDDKALLVHYGIHIRCLVVIPLLVLAELPLQFFGKATASSFLAGGVVTEALRPQFQRVTDGMIRLRNASLPWALAVGVAIAWTIGDPPSSHSEELAWSQSADGRLGFGGAWFGYVSRPILVALLVGWLWRLLLVTLWMWRTSRIGLALVPTHPDRTGGIGFVGNLPAGFSLLSLALSAMFASGWAFQILHRGVSLQSYQMTAIAFVLSWSLLLLLPLFAFAPLLWKTRWNATQQYSVLAGSQGRLVHRLWIDRKPDVHDAPLLEPQGLGVTADTGAAFEIVAGMRVVPADRRTIAAILLPLAIPFALLALASLPLDEIMSTLLSVLK